MTQADVCFLNKEDITQRFHGAKVLVVGDVMLDRYWFGDTNRISPEAPVPVTKIEKTENRAGGAANVARNIVALGGQAMLLSVIGNDEAGNELKSLMEDAQVDAHFLLDESINTTVKLRVIARNQQLIRLDFENMPQHEILRQIIHQFNEKINDCDLVVLSDYGKGGLTHVSDMIERARRAGKPVLIDPKGQDYLRYTGASMITPNRSELKEVVGTWSNESELTDKVFQLLKNLRLDAILLTRSEEGLSLFSQDNSILNQATQAQEVYDVSGAGDTVMAGMALSMAAGLSPQESMYIANMAAGVVVGKVGTAVCSLDELLDAIGHSDISL